MDAPPPWPPRLMHSCPARQRATTLERGGERRHQVRPAVGGSAEGETTTADKKSPSENSISPERNADGGCRREPVTQRSLNGRGGQGSR